MLQVLCVMSRGFKTPFKDIPSPITQIILVCVKETVEALSINYSMIIKKKKQGVYLSWDLLPFRLSPVIEPTAYWFLISQND